MELSTIAKRYHEADYCIIPLRCDGSKAPRIPWAVYPWWQLSNFYASKGSPSGIGLLCGQRSGNLEVLDFDHSEAYPHWKLTIYPELLSRLVIMSTPSGGNHVYYRCDTIESNRVLARDEQGGVYIETRGEGGMVVAAGSPLSVHPLHKPYRLMQGNPLSPPLLTSAERRILIDRAIVLNRFDKPVKKLTAKLADEKAVKRGSRPGDIYNDTSTWEEILEPKGWTVSFRKGDIVYWRKPDGSEQSHHATTGYGSKDMFYCFSTDAKPFDNGEAYSKFAAYTLLYHEGNFQKSAQAIKQLLRGKHNGKRNEEIER